MRTDVVVVGAGPGGLGAAAELQRRGLDVVVVDRAEAIASTWRSAYDRLRLNTVGWLSHLPGRRMPRSAGRWPSRDAVIDYFERYAADEGLDVRLGVEVERVERDDDGWRVRTTEGELTASQVVIATGYSDVPSVPSWPGRDRFAGELVHSSAYRNGRPFAGRDVLVVGAGNSGAEIAVDLAEAGARVRLAVRTPPHVVVRQVGPLPNQVAAIGLRRAPLWLADRVIATSARLRLGDLSEVGLPRPAEGAATRVRREGAIPVVDAGFVEALRAGRIEVVPAVERLTETGAVVAGGREVAAQVIVAATGYRTGLDRLVGHLGVLDARGLPRVHGARAAEAAPGLRFTGFTNPISGNLREMRLDARRIARAVAREERARERRPAPDARAPGLAARCCAWARA